MKQETHEIKTIKIFDGRELILIPIPKSIEPEFEIYYDIHLDLNGIPDGIGEKCSKITCGDICGYITIPADKELLGTLTGHYIPDFDVESFVDYTDYDNEDLSGIVRLYRDYNRRCNDLKSKKDSFQSLLNANDIWMHNPLIKPQITDRKYLTTETQTNHSESYNFNLFREDLTDWQTHQDKVVTKYIVLEKIK